jgi:hypothetical protein
MKKLAISLITLLALLAAALPVAAAEEEKKKPLTVPNVVQIVDPVGDANAQNTDWQSGGPQPDGADIVSAWFDNDASTITAYVQVAVPPSGQVRNWYDIEVNPNNALAPTSGCIIFEAMLAGNSSPGGADTATVADSCGEAPVETEGAVSVVALPDGSAAVAMTFPRSASPHFEKDSILFTPFARSLVTFGAGGGGLGYTFDNTKPGSDYTLVGKAVAPKKEEPAEGEGEEEEPEEEPEQSEPPKKKKKKGKSGCPAMTPHEKGAEAETTVVTEEATEEKPIEVPITAPQGLFPATTGDVYHNIQVDTSGGEKGLFVRYEFPEYEDLDLYLYEAGNDEAVAQAAGFNQAPFVPGETDGTGNGGHSEMGAEQVDGHPSADCAGFTAEMHSFLTEGGEYTLKIWLGEPGGEAAAMRSIYDAALSLI